MKKSIVFAIALSVALCSCKKNGPDEQGSGKWDQATDYNGEYDGAIVKSNEYAYLQKKSLKRGVSFGWGMSGDFDVLGPGVSWSYNWSGTQSTTYDDKFLEYGIEYCPMVWNGNYSEDGISNFVTNHPSTKYLLGFNEPNLTDQANMTPSEAAERWGRVVQLAKRNNLKLVSPAINWGTKSGWHDGTAWLRTFMNDSRVNTDSISAIAVHVYMSGGASCIGDAERYKALGKKIWVTEFCSWNSGSNVDGADKQISFIATVLNKFEQDDMYERYAWFIPRGGYSANNRGMYLLDAGSSTLTKPGVVYVNFSSFDKDVVYPLGMKIPAEHYRACSVDDKYKSVGVEPTTDVNGKLQLAGFTSDYYADYQVGMGGQENVFIQVRYTTTRSNSVLGVYGVNKDGSEVKLTSIELPSTGGNDKWETAVSEAVNLPEGKRIIRLRPESGMIRLNWFRFVQN